MSEDAATYGNTLRTSVRRDWNTYAACFDCMRLYDQSVAKCPKCERTTGLVPRRERGPRDYPVFEPASGPGPFLDWPPEPPARWGSPDEAQKKRRKARSKNRPREDPK